MGELSGGQFVAATLGSSLASAGASIANTAISANANETIQTANMAMFISGQKTQSENALAAATINANAAERINGQNVNAALQSLYQQTASVSFLTGVQALVAVRGMTSAERVELKNLDVIDRQNSHAHDEAMAMINRDPGTNVDTSQYRA